MAEFMKICLTDREMGYYTTKEKIFNEGGDFTTSPEVGQLFGEVRFFLSPAVKRIPFQMIGVWIQVLYQTMEGVFKAQGFPVSIIELGPGTGELALDVLRTLLSLRKSLKGINMGFVEVSEKLRTTQQQKLLKFLQSKGIYMNYAKSDENGLNIETFTSECYPELRFSMSWAENLRKLTMFDLERLKKSKLLISLIVPEKKYI